MTQGICAKPEAAMMPPPGAQGAVVNGGSWVGPVCCHLNSAGDKENTSAGAPVLHPLDNAASLLGMGTTQGAADAYSMECAVTVVFVLRHLPCLESLRRNDFEVFNGVLIRIWIFSWNSYKTTY